MDGCDSDKPSVGCRIGRCFRRRNRRSERSRMWLPVPDTVNSTVS